MAEAPQTSSSIDGFSFLASSPSPPDPSDDAVPRLKSPWSQIVRGSPVSPRSKPAEAFSSRPPSLSAELRASDRIAASANTAPMSSSSIDRRQGVHEEHFGAISSPSDESMNQSFSSDDKESQQSPAKSPKVAWGKLISNPVRSSEREPVMGADAWPALSEARNPKAVEPLKVGAVQKSGPKAVAPYERHNLQTLPLLQQETGTMGHQKQTNQITVNGHCLPNVDVHEASSPQKTMQGPDSGQSKLSGGKDSKVAAASETSPIHVRGTLMNHNKESGRNFMWEQGKGSHSFPTYGRGHASSREQQQRGGQRNVPQPFVPFANPSPGFVYPSGYQGISGVDVPGSMYYIPVSTTDQVLGATYFVQPGVLMPAPNMLSIQETVVRQIEYYFSAENLCRDIYLRSQMDEWGFVPVSEIANFNRVRRITQNTRLITEALRMSNIVEVQGEKVRKKGDWANWLLPPGQPSATASGGKDQPAWFSTSFKKADADRVMPDSSSLDGTDNQVNDHSHIVPQVGEQLQALSVAAVNAQSNDQDFQSHEEAAGSLSEGGSKDLLVDRVNSKKHSNQPCDVESGHGTK